jgi:hypothetical protein
VSATRLTVVELAGQQRLGVLLVEQMRTQTFGFALRLLQLLAQHHRLALVLLLALARLDDVDSGLLELPTQLIGVGTQALECTLRGDALLLGVGRESPRALGGVCIVVGGATHTCRQLALERSDAHSERIGAFASIAQLCLIGFDGATSARLLIVDRRAQLLALTLDRSESLHHRSRLGGEFGLGGSRGVELRLQLGTQLQLWHCFFELTRERIIALLELGAAVRRRAVSQQTLERRNERSVTTIGSVVISMRSQSTTVAIDAIVHIAQQRSRGWRWQRGVEQASQREQKRVVTTRSNTLDNSNRLDNNTMILGIQCHLFQFSFLVEQQFAQLTHFLASLVALGVQCSTQMRTVALLQAQVCFQTRHVVAVLLGVVIRVDESMHRRRR